MTDSLIRGQRVSISLINKPVNVLLGAVEVSVPEKHRHRPDESDAMSDWMIEGLCFGHGLPRDCDRLLRKSL